MIPGHYYLNIVEPGMLDRQLCRLLLWSLCEEPPLARQCLPIGQPVDFPEAPCFDQIHEG